MKLCKDCHHFMPADDTSVMERCSHRQAAWTTGPDLVMGNQPQTKQSYCMSMRGASGECGPDGKLWEPKDAGFV